MAGSASPSTRRTDGETAEASADSDARLKEAHLCAEGKEDLEESNHVTLAEDTSRSVFEGQGAFRTPREVDMADGSVCFSKEAAMPKGRADQVEAMEGA